MIDTLPQSIAERQRLSCGDVFDIAAEVKAGSLDLHHIGSIAVPGLVAKPVIDMMAHVDDLDELVEPIIQVGYQYPEAWL